MNFVAQANNMLLVQSSSAILSIVFCLLNSPGVWRL